MYVVEQVKNCRRVNDGNHTAVLNTAGRATGSTHAFITCFKNLYMALQGLFAGSEQNVSTIFISSR